MPAPYKTKPPQKCGGFVVSGVWGFERTRVFHSAVYVLAVLTWLFTTRCTHCLHITGENKSVPFSASKIPQGQDRDQVKQIVTVLCKAGQLRAAAITKLARATGMRLREAILADIPRLTREARHIGRINIQDGTKGGRSGASAPRWVAVDDSILNALTFAQSVSPQGSKNLLFPDENYRDFLQGCVRPARKLLKYHGLKGFHELRAAYACERYKQITLRPAPINSENSFHLDKNQDREARKIISYELGHSRTDVVSSYIGGAA